MIDLQTLAPNAHSTATAINSAGQVTGVSYDLGNLQPQAFLWENKALTSLGLFTPNAINDDGYVAGTRQTLQGGIWRSEAVMRNDTSVIGLGTLGGDNSFAHGINADGEVVGVSQLSDGMTNRAFYKGAGQIADIGTLGGSQSHAYAINDQRHVVGVADNNAGTPHAFRFLLDAQGQVVERTDLGELGGGNSYALDINEQDVVVGTSDARAFVWEAGSMSDLNELIPEDSGWRLDSARSINDSGWITGYGKHLGIRRAFLLVPVDPKIILGDANGDGVFNNADIASFVLALTNSVAYQAMFPNVNLDEVLDMNGDGVFNNGDIASFVAVLTGGGRR